MTTEIVETPSSHAETAQQRVQELRRWREVIPNFVLPTSTDDARRLNSAASVSPEFIELTNVALANHPPLVRGEGATPSEVRDLLIYADAYSPLADELEAFAQFIRHSGRAARNLAGTEALTTYALAQRLAKQPKTAYLAPHVADMRRALNRGRKASPEAVAQKAVAKAAKAAEVAAKAKAKADKLLPPAVPAPPSTMQ
jgi:hypothetical protein